MKRVLIVKMSSMGDVIHTLPAVTDAWRALGDEVQFDWLVEKSFAEIPSWHPAMHTVIPIRLRYWRRHLGARQTWQELRACLKTLRATKYDLIIDAQGLLKSALFAAMSRGERAGLDKQSARESVSALFYQQKIAVPKKQHAIQRVRQLFATALGYAVPHDVPAYGLDRQHFFTENTPEKYIVFLHGTTWVSKLWPEHHWIALAQLAHDHGFKVRLGWGNAEEQARAARIAAAVSENGVDVLPAQSLRGMASVLAGAHAVVALDTGLTHLAAALAVPTVSLYGPSSAVLTGAQGAQQTHLAADWPSCAPCFQRTCSWRGEQVTSAQGEVLTPTCLAHIMPERVWQIISDIPHLCLFR